MNDGSCVNYANDGKNGSYSDCIGNYLGSQYKPELACMPPWVSDTDQCTGIFLAYFLYL